jgi:ribosome-associated protein
MAEVKTRKLTKRNMPPEIKRSVKASQAKKAEGILVLDLRELASFTDFFIIMTGNSSRQNAAIYEGIAQELKKDRLIPLGVEGRELAEWILMDYGSFIVHVFSTQAREYYSLEKLWADAPRLAFTEAS